jgi:hypothetical protein
MAEIKERETLVKHQLEKRQTQEELLWRKKSRV